MIFDRLRGKHIHIESRNRAPSPSEGSSRSPSKYPEPIIPPNKLSTGVYFANWSIYERHHFPTDIDFSIVDHVYYAFLLIDVADGKVDFLNTWADLEVPLPSPIDPSRKVHGLVNQFRELKQLYPQLKVSFSVGGWGTLSEFETVVLKTRLRERFILSCCDMVSKYGFDGIDIDWEYPSTNHQGRLLCSLIEDLRFHLDKMAPNLRLSLAAPAGKDKIDLLDVSRLNKVVNHWNVMCYDFTGYPWSSRIGFHSNLFGHNGDNSLSGDNVIKEYVKQGASTNKLILGMPLYGRKFGGVQNPQIGNGFDKSALSDEGVVDYKLLPLNNCSELFDPKKVGSFCYDLRSRVFVTYDGVNGVKVKAQYIELHGLGGGMFWDSAGDSKESGKSLIRAFSTQLHQK